MSYPEFSDFPPIPQRSAAEADFDTKMSALFQHFATTHRAEMIALIDFLKTNSTIIGNALNATTVGLDTPAEGKFTALEAPQLDLINAVSGVLAVLGASASDLNIGTNSNHPVDLRVAGIRSILLSTNGTKSFYRSDGSTVGVTINGDGNVEVDGKITIGDGVDGNVNANHLVVSKDVNNLGVSFLARDATGFVRLFLGSQTDDTAAKLQHNENSDELTLQAKGNLLLQTGGTNDRMTINSSGNVGIGTAAGLEGSLTASDYLHIRRNTDGWLLKHQRSDSTQKCGIQAAGHSGNVGLAFYTDDTLRAEISRSGDFGVGTGADLRLAVEDPANRIISRFVNSNASFDTRISDLRASRSATSAYDFMRMLSGGTSDMEFRFRGDGNAFADGSFTGGGADYAEYFEWADGNPGHEDRRGLSVVLDGDKIRPALPGEEPIGVISANPSVVGDGDIDRWKGKYLRDAFGAYIWEDYEALSWTEVVTETETIQKQASEAQERTREVIEVVDGVAVKTVVTETVQVPLFDEFPLVDESGAPVLGGNGSQLIHREPRMVEVQEETTKEEKRSYAADEVPGGVAVPAAAERVTQQRRKLNPDYDPSQDYTPRADRPEWDTVGLMGKLRLLKGQPTGARWIKMRDVSADVEEWLVR